MIAATSDAPPVHTHTHVTTQCTRTPSAHAHMPARHEEVRLAALHAHAALGLPPSALSLLPPLPPFFPAAPAKTRAAGDMPGGGEGSST